MTQNDVDALWRKHSTQYSHSSSMSPTQFKEAITEALAGRWKDEDVRDFAVIYRNASHSIEFEELLSQFKSERGIK